MSDQNPNSFTSGFNDMSGSNPPQTPNVMPPTADPNAPNPQPSPMPTAQATPTGQPTPQPQAPTSPAQKVQQLHQSVFHNILSTLAGGDQRPMTDANGQPVTDANGQVQMAPLSKKHLGASILAGALSSMMAGMAAPTVRTPTGGGRSVADYGGSVAAGAAAGQQFTQKGRQQAAQGQADANTARKYATMDHNLKFHSMALANDKADRENQQDVLDTWNSTRDAMDNEAVDGKVQDDKGNSIDLYSYKDISGTKAMELVNNGTSNVTRDQLIPSQVIEVPNADGGGTHPETLFSIYNPSAMVAINDKVKQDNPNLAKVADGTKISVRVLAQSALNRSNQILASSGVANWAKEYNDVNKDHPMKEGFSLKSAADSDPSIAKLYPLINKYRKDSVDQFFNDMEKDPAFAKDTKMQAAAASLQEKMGVTDESLQAMATKRADIVLAQKDKEAEAKVAAEADAKRKTPEGQADLVHKQLENNALRQAAAQTEAIGKGIEIPQGFTPIPEVSRIQDPADLSKQLAAKGVAIPSNFGALFAIGHNAADLATLTTTPRKGVNVMPRDQGLSYIRAFINPQYQEGDFKAASGLSKELASTRVGTAGGTLLAAGTASRHIEMLSKLGDALQNHNLQLLNSIKAQYGVAVGDPNPVVFKAIVQKLNEEVEKVTSGGAPMEAALKQAAENLNVTQSPEQIRQVTNGYIGLMNGRIGEIDDRSMQYFGRHAKGISPSTVDIFNKHGYPAPGQPPTAKGQFTANGRQYWTDGTKNLGPVD